MPTPAPGSSNLLTVAEVAEQLRISRMTVHRMIDECQLPAYRFGRQLRIPASALASFIERSRVVTS